jgi:hypothetical protein
MIDKLKVFGILAIIMFGVYYIATSLRDNELQNIDFINKDFKITKGVVIKKSVQKGNHISVEYNVNGNQYVGIDGFTDYQKVNVGDSIDVKYSITKPELMITEFNEQF